MGQHYKHISVEERCQIVGMKQQVYTNSMIARQLGRDRRTIQRQLARNSTPTGGYKPDTADRVAWARKLRGSKISRCPSLQNEVMSSLAIGWTPEQIAGRLRLTEFKNKISHESIYRYIYSPDGKRQKLSKYLPYHHAKRGYRSRKATRQSPIPDRVPIHLRPDKANDRSEIGHWEGDLVHFSKQKDMLLTLTERKSRYWLMRRISKRDSQTVSTALISILKPLAKPLRKSITHDNGGEFARHKNVTKKTGMTAYFCDPHAPWQRGAVENANGRLRIDLPRNTKLSNYSDRDLEHLAMIYNNIPRKCLGFNWRCEPRR